MTSKLSVHFFALSAITLLTQRPTAQNFASKLQLQPQRWSLAPRCRTPVRSPGRALANFHRVADPHHREQLPHVAIAQPDASMRSCMSDRTRRVRSMNSVALHVQADPAGAQRIVLARRHHDAGVIVSRIGDAVDDHELARRTRAYCRPDCNREIGEDVSFSSTASLRSGMLTSTTRCARGLFAFSGAPGNRRLGQRRELPRPGSGRPPAMRRLLLSRPIARPSCAPLIAACADL